MMKKRQDRVDKNRDRSKKWMMNATRKLLNDKDALNQLNLTEYEKKNIGKFHATEGCVDKVMARQYLTNKKKQSDRKLTVVEYVRLRPGYLKQERKFLREIKIIVNDEWDKNRCYDVDEVPVLLSGFNLKQLTLPNEHVSIKKPPHIT